MFQNLFAALVPAVTLFLEPPLLPPASGVASVGVRVEPSRVSAENFSDAPRWILLSSGGFQVLYALAPHSNVVWECTEECLWNVSLQIADTDGGALHLSHGISLYSALECAGQSLWFGQSPDCWLETGEWLEPYFGGCSDDAAPALLHVPVIRPSDKPNGDLPPVIDPKPLPPF